MTQSDSNPEMFKPDGGVENAAEPDDEADDAGGVHGGVLLRPDDNLLGKVVDRGPVGVGAQVQDLCEVALAELVGLVGERAPGQVHDVHRDEGGLQQPRVGEVLLDDGEHGGDGEDDAQDHVERDEELVQPAVTGVQAWNSGDFMS